MTVEPHARCWGGLHLCPGTPSLPGVPSWDPAAAAPVPRPHFSCDRSRTYCHDGSMSPQASHLWSGPEPCLWPRRGLPGVMCEMLLTRPSTSERPEEARVPSRTQKEAGVPGPGSCAWTHSRSHSLADLGVQPPSSGRALGRVEGLSSRLPSPAQVLAKVPRRGGGTWGGQQGLQGTSEAHGEHPGDRMCVVPGLRTPTRQTRPRRS